MNGPQHWNRTGHGGKPQASLHSPADDIEEAHEVDVRNIDVPAEKARIGNVSPVHSRWWFSATAAPMLAGTFGPMASAFNVCALTQGWAESLSSTADTGMDIPNPTWVVVTNAISLASALIANLILLSKFSRGSSLVVCYSLIIIGWYISVVLLTTTIAVASSLVFAQGSTSSQAFYYACFAAGLYFIVSSLMLISLYGSRSGHYGEELRRVSEESTLSYQAITFTTYLLCGAAIYSNIEGWNYLDAVFWADCTILTIGLGDYAPKTHLGRSLLFPYAAGGVVLLGVMISSIRSFVSDRQKRQLRRIVKEQRRILLQRTHSGSRRDIDKELFTKLRDIQVLVSQKQQWILLLMSTSAWFTLWLVSAGVFRRTERSQGWSYFQALYFTFTSIMTIGYGDLCPTSNAGKSVFVLWSLLAVPTITVLISSMPNTIIQMLKKHLLWLESLMTRFKCCKKTEISKELSGKPTQLCPPGKKPPNRGSSIDHHNGKMRGECTSASSITGCADVPRISKGSMETRWSSEENRPYYHYLLITEISNISSQLHASTQPEYSYEEWKWFVMLISGEHYHNFSDPHATKQGKETISRQVGESKRNVVDGESILARWQKNEGYSRSSQSEVEWILEQLIVTLKRELGEQLRYHGETKRHNV